MRMEHPSERGFPGRLRAALAKGPVILLGGHAAGSGGALMVTPAERADEATVNLMAREARGIVALALDEVTAFRLGLRLQASSGRRAPGRRFLRSIEAAVCTGTGISAADRALTMRAAAKADASAADLQVPGHIMPLVVRTPVGPDASLPDLAYQLVKVATGGRVAGWCDILDDKGDCASEDYCRNLAVRLGLEVIEGEEIARDVTALSATDNLRPQQGFEMDMGWA